MDIGGEGPRSKKRSGGGCPILPGAASPHPTLPCRFIFSKHGLNDYSQVVRWEVMVWRIGRRAARTRESLRMVRDDSTLKRPNSHLNPMKTRTRKEIRMGRRRGQWRLGARRRREEPHSLMRLTSDRPDHRVISQVTTFLFRQLPSARRKNAWITSQLPQLFVVLATKTFYNKNMSSPDSSMGSPDPIDPRPPPIKIPVATGTTGSTPAQEDAARRHQFLRKIFDGGLVMTPLVRLNIDDVMTVCLGPLFFFTYSPPALRTVHPSPPPIYYMPYPRLHCTTYACISTC